MARKKGKKSGVAPVTDWGLREKTMENSCNMSILIQCNNEIIVFLDNDGIWVLIIFPPFSLHPYLLPCQIIRTDDIFFQRYRHRYNTIVAVVDCCVVLVGGIFRLLCCFSCCFFAFSFCGPVFGLDVTRVYESLITKVHVFYQSYGTHWPQRFGKG